ncbi:hypothetical protein Rhe02_58750 [Rhizocola hellebori]|uniref:Uncharacterized protein n=1 Tax=Rhizocola hellebori TaxID=1392758 RepID=A0A8J3QDR0_9ACTN|nr:hypothetical protein [Rhizocola hellebori]GIH07808.1 hypothetical protein Rhe02_58750 [Rhizocola hellebori]
MLTLFVVGLLAGGLLSGLALGLLSGLAQPLPAAGRYPMIVALALLGLLRDTGMVRLPVPQNARQVPQEVLRRNLLRGALQFGFELGTGVRTYVSASAPYVLALAVFLGGQPLWVAALTGVGFGAGRAVTPLIRLASGTVEGWDADLRTWLRVIAASACTVAAVSFATLLLPRL